MNLTTSTIKSIASRNVWSSDWSAPFCKSILFYKKDFYSHTHPEWRNNEKEILKELDISRKNKGYKDVFRINLVSFTERGFHQPMTRKAIYISIGETKNIVLGCKQNSAFLLGEIDKVESVPSWENDFWDRKKIWNNEIYDEQYIVVGNLVTTCVYPRTNNLFIEVLYVED